MSTESLTPSLLAQYLAQAIVQSIGGTHPIRGQVVYAGDTEYTWGDLYPHLLKALESTAKVTELEAALASTKAELEQLREALIRYGTNGV